MDNNREGTAAGSEPPAGDAQVEKADEAPTPAQSPERDPQWWRNDAPGSGEVQ